MRTSRAMRLKAASTSCSNSSLVDLDRQLDLVALEGLDRCLHEAADCTGGGSAAPHPRPGAPAVPTRHGGRPGTVGAHVPASPAPSSPPPSSSASPASLKLAAPGPTGSRCAAPGCPAPRWPPGPLGVGRGRRRRLRARGGAAGSAPALVAAAYLGFAGFSARRDPAPPGARRRCGCFGAVRRTAHQLHVGSTSASPPWPSLAVVDPVPGIVAVAARHPVGRHPVPRPSPCCWPGWSRSLLTAAARPCRRAARPAPEGGPMTVVVVARGVVIAVLALLVVGLLRSHAEILRRLHDLGAGLDGDAAPAAGALPGRRRPGPGATSRSCPRCPSPPDREAFGGAADLAGVGAGGDDAVTGPGHRRRARHPRRLPLLGLPHLPAVLGRLPQAPQARPARRHPPRRRHQGPRRGEPGRRRRAGPARRAHGDVERGLRRLRRPRARRTSSRSTAPPAGSGARAPASTGTRSRRCSPRPPATPSWWPTLAGSQVAKPEPTPSASPGSTASSRRRRRARATPASTPSRPPSAATTTTRPRPRRAPPTARADPTPSTGRDPSGRARRAPSPPIRDDGRPHEARRPTASRPTCPPGWEGRIALRTPPGAGARAAAEADAGPAGTAGRGPQPGRAPGQLRPARGAGRLRLRRGRPDDRRATCSWCCSSTAPRASAPPCSRRKGMPTRLTPNMFSASALQRTLPGQAGCQLFFTVADRAFCCYTVLGRQRRPTGSLPQANATLAATRIAPR